MCFGRWFLIPEVGCVREVWEAAGEEELAELCKEGRQGAHCEEKSKWAKYIGQVVEEEEEVGEQDLA